MKLFLPYDVPNWNEYINIERKNFHAANNLKQNEKQMVCDAFEGMRYREGYPAQITFRPYFKDKRKDLDNTRIKGILDGLVACGVIKKDNLTCIQRIVIEPVFTKYEGIEIEIRRLEQCTSATS